jgi:hypothetical protein
VRIESVVCDLRAGHGDIVREYAMQLPYHAAASGPRVLPIAMSPQ